MKWVTRALVALFVLGLLVVAAGAAAFVWSERQIEAPGPMAGAEDQTVLIPRGAGVIRIGEQLEGIGLISDTRLFRLAARYKEQDASLKAGEYLIPADASILEILDLLLLALPQFQTCFCELRSCMQGSKATVTCSL